MKIHEIVQESIRPPVSYAQIVTREWIEEILKHGFDVGLPHPGAPHDRSGDGFDADSVYEMLSDLQEDGFIPDTVDIEDNNTVMPYLERWLKRRFSYVLKNIQPEKVGNGYLISREIRLSLVDAEKLAANNAPLGNYWSFAHGQSHWGNDNLPSVVLFATVSRNAIDWITTIRRNMNYALGEDEQEVFLSTGTPIRLVSLTFNDIALPIKFPNRTA